MLSIVIFLPLAAAAVLALPRITPRAAVWTWIAAATTDLALVVALWLGYGGGMAYEERLTWIPSVNAGYHVGVDGLSLPLIAMSAVLFLVCAIFSLRDTDRVRPYAALFLFLQTVSIGLFAALDLLLFFVFFDLSIVGMYFVIVGWGHGDRARSALKFFLFYVVAYAVTNLGAFAVVVAVGGDAIEDYTGLGRRSPLLAASLVICLLGLVGTPPTAVFVGKVLVFTAAWDGGYAWLAVVAVVNTVASLFYYLRWILPLFQRGGPRTRPLRSASLIACLAALVSLLLSV